MRKSIILAPRDPKIYQNDVQERFKSDLGSKSVAGCQKRRYIFLEIGVKVHAPWAKGAHLYSGPAGRQGGSKIEFFGTKSIKNRENNLQEWLKKTLKIIYF